MSTQSASKLLSSFLEQYNVEVIENNEIVDALDKAEAKLSTLQFINKDLTERLEKAEAANEKALEDAKNILRKSDKVTKNAEEHMVMLKQANREKAQVQDRLDQALTTLKSYKEIGKTPKQIRDRIKTYQANAETSVKATAAHKRIVSEYRHEISKNKKEIMGLNLTVAQSNMTTLYTKDGQHLLLFPAPLTMMINGKEEKQITLMLMDGSGTGKLIGLNEDGEPQICSAPKGGLRAKAATLDAAGNILRKFRKQNWLITHKDLESIKDTL